jgi:hypothetical protein
MLDPITGCCPPCTVPVRLAPTPVAEPEYPHPVSIAKYIAAKITHKLNGIGCAFCDFCVREKSWLAALVLAKRFFRYLHPGVNDVTEVPPTVLVSEWEKGTTFIKNPA